MATLNQLESSLNGEYIDQDVAAKNKLTLDYIKHLASLTNAKINRWDINKSFGERNNEATLIEDRKLINQIFFNKIKKTKAREKSTETTTLDKIPELEASIKKGIEASLKSRTEMLNAEILKHKMDIRNFDHQAEVATKSLVKAKLEMDELSSDSNVMNTITEELNKVLDGEYWVNPIVHEQKLYLNTKNDIIMSHKKKTAGIDIEINMGQFAVELNLVNFQMKVIPYRNNILPAYSDYYHPHISSDGIICWGNAKEQVRKWQQSLEVGKILNILYSLLFNYCDAQPYTTLCSYKSLESKKYKYSDRRLMHPERFNKANDNNTGEQHGECSV